MEFELELKGPFWVEISSNVIQKTISKVNVHVYNKKNNHEHVYNPKKQAWTCEFNVHMYNPKIKLLDVQINYNIYINKKRKR